MVKYLTAASGQGAVNYMFKEGSSLHDAINLRQTFTQHTQTFIYLGAKMCTLAAKEKLRILLKQNTALLSTVRPSVRPFVCHRRDISHFTHI